MKFNFKKIASIVTAGIMFTSTVGFAAAANYPQPFTDGGAVVYGANADNSDLTASIDVYSELSNQAGGTESTGSTVSGEAYLISATGDDLTFGESLSSVDESLDDGDLPIILAEGTLKDDSVDYDEEEEVDYFQDLYLSGDIVTFDSLDEDDYVINTDAASDELPVLYLDQSSGEAYNLTVDFSTAINASAYDDSESIVIAGKELTFDQEMEAGDTELVLYESTETVTLTKGESKDVNGDTIEVTGGDTDTANLKINGNIESVNEGDSESGYYVNKVVYDATGDGSVSVELFVGATEWSIDDVNSLTDVEIDGDAIDGVQANISSTGTIEDIDSITFQVTPSDFDKDEKSYLEVGETLEDPLFGLNMEFSSVDPELDSDSKGKIGLSSDDAVNLEFTSRNGNEYSISPFEINDGKNAVNAHEDWYANNTYTGLVKDNIFIASEGTGKSEETLVFEVSKINDGDDTPSVEFNDLSDGSTTKVYHNKELKNTGLYVSNITDGDDSFDLETDGTVGSADMAVNNELITDEGMSIQLTKGAVIDASGLVDGNTITINGVVYENDVGANGTTGVAFNRNLSDVLSARNFQVNDTGIDGPFEITGYNVYSLDAGDASATNFTEINMYEDDDEVFSLDSEVGLDNMTVNVTVDTADEYLEMRPSTGSFTEKSVSDTDTVYGVSKLGTYYESDTDEYKSIDIWTPKDGQTKYNVYVSEETATITPGTTGSTSSGTVSIVKDSEVDSVSDKNLFVVGGSCINTVAAKILGSSSPLCGADFTDETGAGAGQYIIKTVESPYNEDKVAMLVAGYNAADTLDAIEKAKEGVTSDVNTSQVYPQITTD